MKCGDIFAVSKLTYTESGDTLCEKGKSRTYVNIAVPAPTLFKGIEPVDKNDDEKMGIGLARLREEDPSFIVRHDPETKLGMPLSMVIPIGVTGLAILILGIYSSSLVTNIIEVGLPEVLLK